jgi:WXG100 family type VII secretion target
MADTIVYRFQEMETAAGEVDGYVDQYRRAADTLVESVTSAVSSWQGESKERFLSLLYGAINEHINNTIPQVVSVISAQIRMSAENMAKTDAELASNIPQSLG